jgi:hypothetical protein
MNYRLAPIVVLLSLTATFSGTSALSGGSDRETLTVHEWGTFTSIAGEDGTAVDWHPQAGPTDLPCFVERNRFNIKGNLSGTIRMETPVLYFYTPRDTTVKVTVRFRRGLITEWFPRAGVTPVNWSGLVGPGTDSTVSWPAVRVVPGIAEDFPVEPGASHYYAARQTDASPLLSGSEMEKFLFYRGVGRFAPPITATVDDEGQTEVRNPAGQIIGDIILFENRGGRIAYEVRHAVTDHITLDPPLVEEEADTPQSELVKILVSNGLYLKEAEAMVETWSDSWFEEGTRLFYVVPRPAVDAIVPLEITPRPTEISRVFVGRMELVTPAIQGEVKEALEKSDAATLRKYGRFLQPIGQRILGAMPPAEREHMRQRLQSVDAAWAVPAGSCR